MIGKPSGKQVAHSMPVTHELAEYLTEVYAEMMVSNCLPVDPAMMEPGPLYKLMSEILCEDTVATLAGNETGNGYLLGYVEAAKDYKRMYELERADRGQ